jgi:hypothetical protein
MDLFEAMDPETSAKLIFLRYFTILPIWYKSVQGTLVPGFVGHEYWTHIEEEKIG